MVKHLASDTIKQLTQANKTIATAESCTGGMLSCALTDTVGSSAVFERGFITYSNTSKIESLGVKPDTINKYGAVSENTASEMAYGVLKFSNTDIGIAITGVAGPDCSENKPVGLVYIAIADKEKCIVVKNTFSGDRKTIRHKATKKALEMILEHIA